MIKIGLTGGIGSGKTTIARFFELLNIPVYNSDLEAKRLMTDDAALKQELIALLGEDCYLKSGELNRSYVSKLIFKDSALLAQVNALVHPAVRRDFEAFCKANKDAPYIIQEAAILFETGVYKELDKMILVTADAEERLKRVASRDQLSREEVQAKIDKQWEDKKKIPLSDFVVYNNAQSLLIPQVLEIHKALNQ